MKCRYAHTINVLLVLRQTDQGLTFLVLRDPFVKIEGDENPLCSITIFIHFYCMWYLQSSFDEFLLPGFAVAAENIAESENKNVLATIKNKNGDVCWYSSRIRTLGCIDYFVRLMLKQRVVFINVISLFVG